MTSPMQDVGVMGVAGCGKSTQGSALAEALGWTFIEGDAHHPASNIAKMASGVSLTDDDRRPWLERLAEIIAHAQARDDGGVTSRSALRRGCRDILRGGAARVRFVRPRAPCAAPVARLDRPGHFFPPALLDTQLATLEPLGRDENGTAIPLDRTVERQIAQARRFLRV